MSAHEWQMLYSCVERIRNERASRVLGVLHAWGFRVQISNDPQKSRLPWFAQIRWGVERQVVAYGRNESRALEAALRKAERGAR